MMSGSLTILLLQLVSVIYVAGEELRLSTTTINNYNSINDGADDKLAPFQAFVVKGPIRAGANMTICRGALVKNNALLTSALCISKLSMEPKDLIVLNGRAANQNEWNNSTVSKITPHPKFNAALSINNIAVVHLNKPFSSKTISYTKNPPKDSAVCKAYSYKLSPQSVVGLEVKTTCVHMCQKAYSVSSPRYEVDIDTMLCANDTNKQEVICEDDVGASLVCDDVLTGLAIYTQECVNIKMSSVYVSISSYSKWIHKTINSSSTNSMSSLSVIIGTIISFSITKLLAR